LRLEQAPRARLAFVRPGPEALAWLDRVVRDLKQDDPLRPVTVLVPNDYAGRMVHWHLGRHGGYVNVITCRLSQLIASVAQSVASKRVPPLLPVLEEAAARQALRRYASAFGTVSHRSLQQALVELFRELRRREVDLDGLNQTRLSKVARAALGVYREFQAMTVAGGIQRRHVGTNV
jgi:ATP-dependent helicase/nuclease subunit B